MSTAPDSAEHARRSGRRAGTSHTREAILAAASRQFSEHGYDRTSLRAIASDAGVDQKLIAYFFGSKQALFIAAVGLPLNPAELLPAILTNDPDRLEKQLTEILTELLEQPALYHRLTGVIRAAASEPEIARMMREFLHRELYTPAARLLDRDDARLRLNLFGSQLVGLIMARYVLALEPLASMNAAAVARAVAPTLKRYLLEPLETNG